jgi:hypothetical protein
MLVAAFVAASTVFVAAALCGWPVGGAGSVEAPPSPHPARAAEDAGLQAWLADREDSHGR